MESGFTVTYNKKESDLANIMSLFELFFFFNAYHVLGELIIQEAMELYFVLVSQCYIPDANISLLDENAIA